MKRILCIVHSLNTGGAETFLMKIYRTLPGDKYQMDFIVSEPDGYYTKEVLDRGGRIYNIPQRRKAPIKAMYGIFNVVRSNGYESILKLGDTPIAALDLIAAKFGGAKILGMRSCNALTNQSGKSKMLDALLRPVLNAVANVKIAPSMLAAEFTFGKRCAHKEVKLLHNGVDLTVFRFDPDARSQVREEFALSDKFVVGHIGRFHKQKNHRYLLEVFRQIRKIRADAVLMLVGTGELEGDIHAWVKEMDLEGSVIFTGVRFDVPRLLSTMDVFVFPSLHEGMPNTIIEAQATGLPCVLADTITPEADITGLLTYMPLDHDYVKWAHTAVKSAEQERANTRQLFLDKGYAIEAVSAEFVQMKLPND